jgi:hypothetical protein
LGVLQRKTEVLAKQYHLFKEFILGLAEFSHFEEYLEKKNMGKLTFTRP